MILALKKGKVPKLAKGAVAFAFVSALVFNLAGTGAGKNFQTFKFGEQAFAQAGAGGNSGAGSGGTGGNDGASAGNQGVGGHADISSADGCVNWTDYIKNPRCFFAKIVSLQLRIIGLWLLVAGLFLNEVVQFSIVHMTDFVRTLTVIDAVWQLIRDMGNMAFIFVMLYISIGTILGLQSIDTNRIIRNIILAALLVNFSMFFAKVIIDASNVLATGIYKNAVSFSKEGVPVYDSKKLGLSGAIMQGLNLTSIYDVSPEKAGGVGAAADTALSKIIGGMEIGYDSIIISGLLGTVLVLIAAFIFFATGLLLLLRFVVLVFLMMVSPVAFLAMVLPQTSKFSKMWWNSLLSQALFAPTLMLMLYIAIKFINSPAFKAGYTANAGPMWTFITFFIAITLLLLAIIVAKKMGAVGADVSQKWAGSFSLGAAGWAGRQTAGRLGLRLTESNILKEAAISGGAAEKFVSRLILKGADKAYKGSFDLRGSEVLKGALGAAGLKADFGKAQEGGFEEDIEKYGKRHEEFVKVLGRPEETPEEKQAKKDAREALENHRAEVAAQKEKLGNIQNDIKKAGNGKLAEEEAEKLEKKAESIRKRIEAAEARDDQTEAARLKDELESVYGRMREVEEGKFAESKKAELETSAREIRENLKAAEAKEAALMQAKHRADNRGYRYAEALEEETKTLPAQFTITKRKRRAAAKKIRDGVTKGVDKKLKDVLKELGKEAGEEGGVKKAEKAEEGAGEKAAESKAPESEAPKTS